MEQIGIIEQSMSIGDRSARKFVVNISRILLKTSRDHYIDLDGPRDRTKSAED